MKQEIGGRALSGRTRRLDVSVALFVVPLELPFMGQMTLFRLGTALEAECTQLMEQCERPIC